MSVQTKSKKLMPSSSFDHDTTMSRVPEVGYDTFWQWISPAWNIFIVLILAVASSAILSFSWFSAGYSYPISEELLINPAVVFDNTTDPYLTEIHRLQIMEIITKNVLVQAIAVFLSLVMVRFCFVKYSGEAQDPYLLFWSGFSEMLLHTKYNAPTTSQEVRNRLTVIVKIIIVLLGNLVGWYLGYVATIGWASNVSTDSSFSTSDCAAINFTSAPCVLYPRYDPAKVSTAAATLLTVLGTLLSFASYYMAYTLIRHKETIGHKIPGTNDRHVSNVNALGFAILSALGPALAHILFAKYVGLGYNTYYWLIAISTTSAAGQSDVYAWPGFIVGLIVLIAHLICHLLWKMSGKTNKAKKYTEL